MTRRRPPQLKGLYQFQDVAIFNVGETIYVLKKNGDIFHFNPDDTKEKLIVDNSNKHQVPIFLNFVMFMHTLV
jgi:hypothetical protein